MKCHFSVTNDKGHDTINTTFITHKPQRNTIALSINGIKIIMSRLSRYVYSYTET